VAGAVYFNTTAEEVRFYNGTAWERPEYAASQSAIAAQSSATAASGSASAASTSASNAAGSASAALTSANNAATSETNASNSASAASTSATNASNSASSASTSATNASNSETNAATSATNAASSATAAAASATLAASYTPSQTGNSGKYLTTDGTNTSWDALAAVANSGAYSDLSGTPTLATVATSGAYSDLSGTPSLATVATSGSYNDLTSKPTIPTDLDSLSDVVITSPATNQSLVYNGTNWVNASGGGGVTSLTGTANEIDVSSSTGAVTISLPATINANLNGNASTATNASSADQAFEWKGSGSTSNWNTHFQDTLPASCTQIDLNAGTNVPTGGGWWFAQSFRHSNSSNFWGTQYAHGWEDRAYQRWVRNVQANSFGTWMLDVGARVWVNFNGTNAAIRGSGNVSSISFNGTGNYTVNFATALIDANYAISSIGAVSTNYLFILDARYAGGVASTTQYQIITANVSGGAQNPGFLSITIHR
jgi:hypothetical protein